MAESTVSNNNKKIAKNTLFLYLRMGAVLLISLYVTRAALRVLGAEDYGIYNVVCGFVTLFGALNLSLATCINRFYNYEIGKGDVGNLSIVYNTAIIIQLIIAFFLFIILETIGLWYLNYRMVIPIEKVQTANIIYHISVISLIFTVMQSPFTAAVLSFEKMNFYAIVSIIDVFLKLGIVLLLPIKGFDTLLLYAILLGLISLVNFFLYFTYCKIKFKQLVFSFVYKRFVFKSMMSFIGWNFLDPISYNVRGQGCNILLNAFFGPIINAAYTISNQVATALDTFTVSISTAFRPQLIQSYSAANYERSTKLILSMSKIMYCLYLMISLPVIIEVEYLFNLWLVDFPRYAVDFTILILIIKQLNVLNPALTTSVMASGNIKKYSIVSCFTICSIIPLSCFFLKYNHNPNLVYFLMIILTILNQVFCVRITCKLVHGLNLKIYFFKVLVPCFVQSMFLIPLVLLSSLFFTGFLRLVLVCLCSVVLSVLFFYLFVLNKEEKMLANNLVISVKGRYL